MEELDLKELFKIFWNAKWIIILIVILGAVLGAIYTTQFVTPKYSSSTTLVLATSNNGGQRTSDTSITATDITINSKLVDTYSELVKSKNVLRQVMSNMNINMTEDDLRKSISVTSVKNTELIEITVTNVQPEVARDIANEIAKVFIEMVEDIYNIENVHVVDEAEVESIPSNINHTKDIVIFAGAGFLLAVLVIIITDLFDTTVKSAEEIESTYGLYVLASLPLNKEMKKGGK